MVVKAGLSTFFLLNIIDNLHLRKINISICERLLDLAHVAACREPVVLVHVYGKDGRNVTQQVSWQ